MPNNLTPYNWKNWSSMGVISPIFNKVLLLPPKRWTLVGKMAVLFSVWSLRQKPMVNLDGLCAVLEVSSITFWVIGILQAGFLVPPFPTWMSFRDGMFWASKCSVISTYRSGVHFVGPLVDFFIKLALRSLMIVDRRGCYPPTNTSDNDPGVKVLERRDEAPWWSWLNRRCLLTCDNLFENLMVFMMEEYLESTLAGLDIFNSCRTCSTSCFMRWYAGDLWTGLMEVNS